MKIRGKKIVATIEARMTSSRLPGKVMMTALGKPMLQIQIERIKRSEYIDEIIVATTVNKYDDVITELLNKINVNYYRGSEEDVMDRVCKALMITKADIEVQLTGDCPLIDPLMIDEMIEEYLKLDESVKFYSNSGPDISMPIGFDIQIYRPEDLFAINNTANNKNDREHVSLPFYQKETMHLYNPVFKKYTGKLNRPELRVTLDYKEDYELIKACYESLVPKNSNFTASDIIDWIDQNKEYNSKAVKVSQLNKWVKYKLAL